jgi:hypothetical protein
VYARSHRNHTDSVVARGTDIGRRISDCADRCALTREQPGLLYGSAVNIGAIFQPVAESVKIEVAEQIAAFELDAADCPQISRSNSDDRLAPAQMLQDLTHSRQNGRTDLLPVPLYVGAHPIASRGKLRPPR